MAASINTHHLNPKEFEKNAPWITRELLTKIRKRDFLKKKAIPFNNPTIWDQFRCARNQANNAIKLAKKLYVSDNLEAVSYTHLTLPTNREV